MMIGQDVAFTIDQEPAAGSLPWAIELPAGIEVLAAAALP
jgi:hypothetical protein